MTAPLNLDALQALCDAATTGPWTADGCRIEGPWDDEWEAPKLIIYDEGGHSEEDAAFIAVARSALPALIQEVRKGKARIAELEKQVRLLKYNNRAMEAELRGEENP